MGRTAATDGSGGGGGFDFTAAGLEACIKASLSRLGISSVDCLALHDVEFAPAAVLREEALPYLEHLRATGVCRAAGVTGYPHGLLTELGLQREVPLDYVVSYNHGTLQNNTVARLTDALRPAGVSVWEASPLALGYLADGPTQPWLPLPAQMQRLKQACVSVSQAYASRLSSTAMQYHLTHRAADATMVGAKTVAELEDVLQTWRTQRAPEAGLREVTGQVLRGLYAQLPDRGGHWDQEWNDHSGMDLQYRYPGHDGWASV
jgi:aryl-alcohol dehydrogenase-like predicted oxidoreductase